MPAVVDAIGSLLVAIAAMFVAVLLGTEAPHNLVLALPAAALVALAGYCCTRMYTVLFYSRLRR